MSDYTKDARWGGKTLQSIFSVILAFAMAFAFSGLSATQLAHADEYTIDYELAGGKLPDGSNNPTNYTDEDGDITLVNPIRDGYNFAGWTGTDLNAATETVTIPANGTGNREYTATWTLINYPITYTLGDTAVAGTPANPDTYTIESDDITLSNPTRTGYNFAGWTGTGLSGATMVVTIDKGSMGEREYTATWTLIDYTITYNLDGGTNAASNPASYNIETETFTLADPKREGYDFTGWTTTESSTPTKGMKIAKGTTGTLEYTANWEKQSTETKKLFYTVKYVGLADEQETVEHFINVPVDSTETTLAVQENDINKAFVGYTIESVKLDNGTDVKAGDQVPTGSVITVTYAKNEATYTVTYNLAGGTSAAEKLAFSDLEVGANTPTIANPTREGYTFKGWNPEVAATVTADVTYTAQWKAVGGSWVKKGDRWWYRYSDGTYPKSAWLDVNGKYYHFDGNGWMQRGWLQTNMSIENQKLDGNAWFYLDSTGAMATGWQKINGKWYYMLTTNDPQNSDGMNQTGVMVADTTKNIGGKIYSFAKSGAMITGWQKSGGAWFYYDTTYGTQVSTKWIKSGDKWYWLSDDGTMATNAWVDGNNYYVDANGVMLTGWQKIGTTWYYLGAGGKKVTNGWVKSGTKWYWLNSGGSMATNAWVCEGNYYVNADGVMLAGWQRIGTNSLGEPTLDSTGEYAYYFFESTGKKLVNNWKKSGGSWYWLGENGTMAENGWVCGGNYYVGAKGVMVTGTERIQYDSKGTETLDKQGRWATYYFNDTGKVAINQWVKMDGKWYWFGENGYMVQGAWVDGDKYYVNDEGVYIPNYREDPTADDDED